MITYVGNETKIPFILQKEGHEKINHIERPEGININDHVESLIANNSQQYIFDIEAIKNTEEDILEAILKIKKMTKADIVILALGYKGNEKILMSLKSAGFTKFITASHLTDIHDSYSSLSKEKEDFKYNEELIKTKEDIRNEFLEANPKFKILSEDNKKMLKIAVVGSQPRIGTTTVALNLMKMFNFADDNCSCYIECNKTGFAKSLIDNMECTYNRELDEIKLEGDSLFRDVKKIKDIEKEGYNKIIYDFGVLTQDNIEAALEKDIVIAVVGAKTLEIEHTLNTIKLTNAYPNFAYIYNFIPENDRNNIKLGQGDIAHRTFFLSYAPDETKLSIENRDMLQELIGTMHSILPKTRKTNNIFKRLFGK